MKTSPNPSLVKEGGLNSSPYQGEKVPPGTGWGYHFKQKYFCFQGQIGHTMSAVK